MKETKEDYPTAAALPEGGAGHPENHDAANAETKTAGECCSDNVCSTEGVCCTDDVEATTDDAKTGEAEAECADGVCEAAEGKKKRRRIAGDATEPVASARENSDGTMSLKIRLHEGERVVSENDLREMLDKAYRRGRNEALRERLEKSSTIKVRPSDADGWMLRPQRRSVWG